MSIEIDKREYASALREIPFVIRYKLREQIAEKMFRDNRTITISEVAEQTGIARAVLSNLVNKRGYNTLTDNLDRLCAYFGCGLNDIAEYVRDLPREPERKPVSNAPPSPKPARKKPAHRK
jgi:DNA-binding Xre family transcriptional regulator